MAYRLHRAATISDGLNSRWADFKEYRSNRYVLNWKSVLYVDIYKFLKNHILTVIEKVDVTFNRRHSTFFPSIDLYIFFDVPFRKG